MGVQLGAGPRQLFRPELRDKTLPVGVIEGEVDTDGEETILSGGGNDEANILCKVFPVVLQNTALFSLMIASGREDLATNLVF